jgi:Family of unknown function (DUF5302)
MSDDTGETTPDDVKAKMKEALDRKHAAEQAGQAHLDGHARPEHPHGKSGGPQRFQRKTG